MTRKGTLTGGYHDTRRSKLENQRMIEELSRKTEQLQGEKSTISHQLQGVSTLLVNQSTYTCMLYMHCTILYRIAGFIGGELNLAILEKNANICATNIFCIDKAHGRSRNRG